MSTPVGYRRSHRRMVHLCLNHGVERARRGDLKKWLWPSLEENGLLPDGLTRLAHEPNNGKPKRKQHRRGPRPHIPWYILAWGFRS